MTSLKPLPVTYRTKWKKIDARHDIQKNADGSWTANGHMPLEDLVQYVPLPLDENVNITPLPGC
ncbi:Putative capsular polysaccharide transport protein [Escherichia coli]|uniref:Capsular polysaccharide transport protein n=1 Tax=Escherichia coli TaxID=562 RepID=A0A377BAH3_ECOLX|nr:Putative capsular polysaccharide transport protein [Escherichia coli]